jgi:hypothetical protein
MVLVAPFVETETGKKRVKCWSGELLFIRRATETRFNDNPWYLLDVSGAIFPPSQDWPSDTQRRPVADALQSLFVSPRIPFPVSSELTALDQLDPLRRIKAAQTPAT